MSAVQQIVPLILVMLVIMVSLARSGHPERMRRQSQRWMERQVGGWSPRLVEQMAPLLETRIRWCLVGSLIGGIFGAAIAIPVNRMLEFPTFVIPFAGFFAGHFVGAAVNSIIQAARATPPTGVRVALSTPPRTGCFWSRLALVAYALAAGLQVGWTVVVLVTTGGRSEPVVLDVVLPAAGVLVIMAASIVGARYIPWLIRQPFYARDEFDLRTEVAWRREQINDVMSSFFSLMCFASGLGLLGSFPGGTWSTAPMWLFIILGLTGALVQASTTDGNPVRALPPEQERPTPHDPSGRLPDQFVPAPGTNGWVFSRKQRPTG